MAELANTTDVTVDSVPIEMLDYGYVGSCTDVKLVQKILAVLKSGKEGLYPDLIKFTEEKYMELLPLKERKKYQAMNYQTTSAEKYEAEQEIRQWSDNAKKSDQFVLLKPVKKDIPVRGTSAKPVETKTVDNPDISARTSTSQADTKRYPFLANSQVMKLLSLRREHSVLSHSELQRQHIANQEKLKGNECFKMNENEKAILHYSKSLAFDDSKAAIWANRAMTYIRLELFNYAEDDCSVALSLDSTYVKALFRRGLVRFKMGKYAESIADFGHAMLLEPDNLELAKLWKSALDKYAEYPDVPVQSDGSSSAYIVTLLHSEKDALFPADLSKWECVHSGSFQSASATAVSSGLVGIPVYPDYSTDVVMAIDEASVQMSQRDVMASRYKDIGNKMIRSPPEAIRWYDLSLHCNGEYVPSLNNRAQANLTTKDYVQVVNDSTVVLKLEPVNLKALYRRAVALHGLQRLDGALEDIVSLLSMDRGNLQAAKLYTTILLDRARTLSGDAAKSNDVVRECSALLDFVQSFVAKDDAELKDAAVRAMLLRGACSQSSGQVSLALADAERALQLQPDNEAAQRLAAQVRAFLKDKEAQLQKVPESASSAPAPSAVSASVASSTLPPPPPSVVTASKAVVDSTAAPATFASPPRPPPATKIGGASSSVTASALKHVNSPLPGASTPLHPPRTMNEFERVWRSMKGQPVMFAGYLELFKSSTFEKVIKESISPECLSSIFTSWRDHFSTVESRLSSMKNFSKISGFRFMLSILPEEDLKAIRVALDDAYSRSDDKETVIAVRGLYNM